MEGGLELAGAAASVTDESLRDIMRGRRQASEIENKSCHRCSHAYVTAREHTKTRSRDTNYPNFMYFIYYTCKDMHLSFTRLLLFRDGVRFFHFIPPCVAQVNKC